MIAVPFAAQATNHASVLERLVTFVGFIVLPPAVPGRSATCARAYARSARCIYNFLAHLARRVVLVNTSPGESCLVSMSQSEQWVMLVGLPKRAVIATSG